MTPLPDTAVSGSSCLSPRARASYEAPEHVVVLVVVSAWEMMIQHALGRLDPPEVPSRFIAAQRVAHGTSSLPLDEEHVLVLERMPAHHRNPFDRMLAGQAPTHGLTILTSDEDLRKYPMRSEW